MCVYVLYFSLGIVVIYLHYYYCYYYCCFAMVEVMSRAGVLNQ